ncbi:lytic transglycosylase [Thioclava sp. GXIMD4216]|uniref:Lytic transglycosylase n=1 Tax=Thioclava litoralis TaxID=3076557 RepID=A0ABZ1E2K3_9RHOB|nr:lytic transglycosylase [Thioclava sp. FTW29]
MKKFAFLALALLAASCGGGNYKAPQNLDDACALSRERPAYFKAMKRTESRWGIPVYVQMATIHQESRFVGNAKTPFKYALGVIPMGRQSSAYGYSQALDATWEEYRDSGGGRGARRNRIQDATDFIGWYMDGTSKKLGIPKTDAMNQYLAYHEGRGGFANGSHKSKPWLLAVARKVQSRALMYRAQLASCRR